MRNTAITIAASLVLSVISVAYISGAYADQIQNNKERIDIVIAESKVVDTAILGKLDTIITSMHGLSTRVSVMETKIAYLNENIRRANNTRADNQ